MLLATVLALSSAVLHTAWNMIVKEGRDRLLVQWGVTLAGALLSLPWLVIGGAPEARVWPFIIVSALVHVVYSIFLVQAYEHGDLSSAYPIARGSAPLLIAIGGAVWLDDTLGLLGFVGVLLVTCGLVLISNRGPTRTAIGWALATGITISLYSLVDAAGVRRGDESWRYVMTLFLLHALLLSGVTVSRRRVDEIVRSLRLSSRTSFIGGAASLAAYGFVLLAVRSAPLGYVAALRESSVILAALAGWYLLDEAFGVHRTIGAAVVASGIGLILIP